MLDEAILYSPVNLSVYSWNPYAVRRALINRVLVKTVSSKTTPKTVTTRCTVSRLPPRNSEPILGGVTDDVVCCLFRLQVIWLTPYDCWLSERLYWYVLVIPKTSIINLSRSMKVRSLHISSLPSSPLYWTAREFAIRGLNAYIISSSTSNHYQCAYSKFQSTNSALRFTRIFRYQWVMYSIDFARLFRFLMNWNVKMMSNTSREMYMSISQVAQLHSWLQVLLAKHLDTLQQLGHLASPDSSIVLGLVEHGFTDWEWNWWTLHGLLQARTSSLLTSRNWSAYQRTSQKTCLPQRWALFCVGSVCQGRTTRVSYEVSRAWLLLYHRNTLVQNIRNPSKGVQIIIQETSV